MDLPRGEVLAALRTWLPPQRWFAGKGQAVRELRFAAITPLGPDMWNSVVLVDGVPYQVPLCHSDAHDGLIAGALRDGARFERAMSALLESARWLVAPPHPLRFRPLTVEQSHSAGVCAEQVFVKLYRRLTQGLNPEVEVPLALSGSQVTPRLLGWMDTEFGTGALLQEYLPHAAVGWDLARQGPFDAYGLGRTTAQLHSELARAFPTGTEDVREAIVDRLQAIDIPEVAQLRPALLERIEPLGAVPVQRIHGDYHLGQVLHSDGAWKVIDFEGEPDRPGRGALDSPWRDVAGMLRSFDYAGSQAGPEFLAGYGMPAEADLLTAFLIDKAAFEVLYEKRNRPDWVHIPLRALRDLAAG